MRRLLLVLMLALAVAAPARAWTWPADGPVVQPFSFDRELPKAPGFHRGIDVAGPPGALVRAPAAGVVSFAGTVPSNGRCVTIETVDGWSVTLTHLGSIAVIKGAAVVEGDGVGTIGPSDEPGVTDPHVHLGIRRTVDEYGYVDPVSMLPLRSAAAPVDPGAGLGAPDVDTTLPVVTVPPAPIVSPPGPPTPAATATATPGPGAGPDGGDPTPPGSPPPELPPVASDGSSLPATTEGSVATRSVGANAAAAGGAPEPVEPAVPSEQSLRPDSQTAPAGERATVVSEQPPHPSGAGVPAVPTMSRDDMAAEPTAVVAARRPEARRPEPHAAVRVERSAEPGTDPRVRRTRAAHAKAGSAVVAAAPRVAREAERTPGTTSSRQRSLAPPRAKPSPPARRAPDGAVASGDWAAAPPAARADRKQAHRGAPTAAGAVLVLLVVLALAGTALLRLRRRPLPRPLRMIDAHVGWGPEDPGGACVALRRGPQAPGSRRGVRSPVRRLRAVPPPERERRAHGQRDGRARHARDGRRGPRREVVR
jgi:hypothetical protein